MARAGGPLTWGVCRQNLRTAIRPGSIVVFFSFTPQPNKDVVYRLCAVSTVVDKLDHRVLCRDKRFTKYRELYINGLIAPTGDRWCHNESDRPEKCRHKDWLWRIADHRQMTHKRFDKEFRSIYEQGWFSEADIGPALRIGRSHVLFSRPPDRADISPNPPEVARFSGGKHERWCDQALKTLPVDEAALHHKRKRDFLRVNNSSGRNLRRHIRFDLPIEEANRWRGKSIKKLTQISNQRQYQGLSSPGQSPMSTRSVQGC